MAEIADALVLAERTANPQSEVLECLSHLSWHREQLPRRIMQKATLESCFNHMTRSRSLAIVMSILNPFLNGFLEAIDWHFEARPFSFVSFSKQFEDFP